MKTIAALMMCLFTSPLLMFAQLPNGAVANYQLNNTVVDISGNGYNGSITGTTATTNRFGTANSATAFVYGVSSGLLPGALVTAMSNDFSLGYWFKTTTISPVGTAWYSGNALLDAEVCGAVADWGTALINTGKVCFGTGSPDITIISPANYNDGAWHFVTATRNMTAGTIILYVDGIQVATASGASTQPLIAPTLIGLGRNVCSSSPVFEGSLDDIVVYNRVLNATEVTNLYNYYNLTVLPVQWQYWNGNIAGNYINLQWQTTNAINNDHFEIEHSTDGNNFTVIATVNAGSPVNNFTDQHPAPGNNYYRIRQVDADGKYSVSPVLKFATGKGASSVLLQTNPVANQLVLVNSNKILLQRVQVTDASGRLVKELLLQSKEVLIKRDLQLESGYYFLKIISEAGNTTLPFIKQ